jgi:hypothetical protein
MRTTIKLRIKEASDAEPFIERLKEFLDEQETNVSLQLGNERWTHFGKPQKHAKTQEEKGLFV